MEEIKQIGLNIWGLRGGHKSFCHSDNLDIEAPEIKGTMLPDIREFLSISDQTVRFYALEFTSQYKAYTIYRSENDFNGRSDAYLAITLFVPHSLKINHILELLRQISDAYNKDHYDAFGNPNTNPDYIEIYLDLIKNYAGNIVRETEVRNWECSAQNGTPRIMPFTSLSVVEEFFNKPYRKEFLNNQEVMFWDVECLQNQQSHGLTFLKKEIISSGALFDTDGKNIAPQFEGGAVRNAPEGCTIERFEREGVDISRNWQSCFFYDKTNVAIAMKKSFYQPFTYRGPLIGVGSPFVKRGDDYAFSPRLDFRPRHYEVPVNVANVGSTTFDLYFDNQRVSISGGRGVFGFDSTLANGTCKVTIKPDGVTEMKVGDISMSKLFSGSSDDIERLQPYFIENLKAYRFVFNKDCRGRLKLRWFQNAISFSTVNKVFEIVLTSEKNASDFIIEVDGYKTEMKTADNTTIDVMLTKASLNVGISVPEVLKRYLFYDSFVLKVGGQTYKGMSVNIPLVGKDETMSLGIALDNKGHVADCEYDKLPNGDDFTLIPKLALLQNSTDKTMKLTAKNTSFEVFANSTIAVPASFEISSSDNYNVEIQSEGQGIRKMVITAKASFSGPSKPEGSTPTKTNDGSNTSGYQSGYQGGYQGGSTTNKQFVGKYRFAGKEYNLYTDECTKIGNDTYMALIGGRECVLCFDDKRNPLAEKQKQQEEANVSKGLRVTAKKDYCMVEVIPEKAKANKPIVARPTGGTGKTEKTSNSGNTGGNGGNGNNGKRRWLLWGSIGLGALLLIGGIVWLVLALSGSERILKIENVPNYTFDVNFIPKGKGHKMDSIGQYYYHLDKKCTQVVVHVKGQVELYDTIDINQNMFKKEKNHIYTVNNIETKVYEMIRKKELEENNLRKQNEDKILNDFEKYLRKVWSLECSLKMLDTLAICNNSINEYLGLSNSLRNLNSHNPNYDTKKKIVSNVFNKVLTRRDGGDWVEVFIKKQRSFFKNLIELDNAILFSSSKSNWYGGNDRQFFTKDQQDVIDAINTNKPFDNAHELIKKDSLANYTQIKKALENK